MARPQASRARVTAREHEHDPVAPTADVAPEHPVLRLQRAAGNAATVAALGARDDREPGRALVGAPHAHAEREADAVADAVVARIAPPALARAGAPPAPVVRRAPAADASATSSTAAAAPVSADVQRTLDARAGRGRALPGRLRSSFERELRTPLAQVRVHDDPAAHRLSRALGARAFTYGTDVFFGRGQYEPGSREGLHLLAHELAHVAQGAPGIGRKVIRRAVQTNGGTWEARTYRPVPDGAEILLEFTPGANAVATKIGLIQRSKKVEQGVNYDAKAMADYQDPVKRPKLQPAQVRKVQRSDGESHIDRHIQNSNPIYGAPDVADNDIASTPASKLDVSDKAQKKGTWSNYQLGARTKKRGIFGSSWKVTPAMLWDKPQMNGAESAAKDPNAPKPSEMIFETTALALDGPQKNTYYGSVSWGFKITDARGPVLEPLAVVSAGDPSAKMQAVIQSWNAGEFAPGRPNPQIPLPPPADDTT